MSAIIFDFDGTIANSFPYVSSFLAEQAGLPPLTEADAQQLRGLSMQAMARQMGFAWWRLPRLFIRGRRRMQASSKHLHPFDGMPELIRQLHKDGHQLYLLSSNNLRNIKAFLRAHDLDNYFIDIYGSVGLFSKAPALKRLLRKHKLNLEDAVYVGDELRDAEAAQSIKLRVISVTWGFARLQDLTNQKPTALAASPAELTTIIGKL
ncbi:MAG: gph 1 [Candidatus Saccharibacteria bacterium]|nr:gph 1 [Candidatus Saccharibacteria bacterium]